MSGDTVEVLSPSSLPVEINISQLYDEFGNEIQTANHAMMKFYFICDLSFPENSVIRLDSTKK